VPTFRVAVSATGTTYLYDYTISNSASARDGIFEVAVVVPPFLPNTKVAFQASPPGSPTWTGVANFTVLDRPSEMGAHVPGKLVLWMPDGDDDQVDAGKLNIEPGQTRGVFRIASPLKPGFTTGKTSGMPYAPPEDALYDAGVARQLAQLDDYFETTTLTLGPMFLPGAPSAEVLANYRTGIARLSRCDGIPHTPAFLGELAVILHDDGIESRLSDRLDHLTTRPGTPIEAEILNCLRLIAGSFGASNGK
jgi:hypothetical protein